MSAELKVLSERDVRIINAIAEILFPPSSVFTKSLSEIPLAREIDIHLSRTSRLIQWDIKFGLYLIEYLFIFTKLKRFSSRSLESRGAWWDRLWRVRLYPLNMLMRLISSTMYMNYYGDSEIAGRIGYARWKEIKKGVRPPKGLFTSHTNDVDRAAEVCIIGSGAGGAIVARSLAEHGHEVVILEAGDYFNAESMAEKRPVDIVRETYQNAAFQVTLGLPIILVPSGRAVGGTTVINSGTCFRLPERVLESWQRDFGLTDIKYKDLIPYFETIERNLKISPVPDSIQGGHSRLIARGLERLGYKGMPLSRNAPGCEGAGNCCFICPTEAKQSLHISYIPQALEKGAKLYARCSVDKIVPLGDGDVEVSGRLADASTSHGSHRIRIKAKVLVISAGTLATPIVIKSNRLLPGNRHVGRHLSLHPAATVKALFDEKVEAWKGVPQGYWMDLMMDEGITFEGAFMPPGMGSVAVNVDRLTHRRVMENYGHVAAFGFMVSDRSSGRVWGLPGGDRVAFYNVQKSELGKYQKAIAFLVDLFAAAGAREIYPGVRSLHVVSPKDGGDLVRRTKIRRTDLDLSAFHPLGTCRMGTSEENSVVDSWGRIHRYRNIYVADGSIFPSSLGVNPQVSIMTFAHRIADGIHEKLLHHI